MLCPGSPNIRLANAVEEKTSSNLESLSGHVLGRSCPIPVIITTTCGDAGDDNQCGAEKFCTSNPDC